MKFLIKRLLRYIFSSLKTEIVIKVFMLLKLSNFILYYFAIFHKIQYVFKYPITVLVLDHEESGPPCSSAMLMGVPISQPGSMSVANSHQNEEPKIHLFLFPFTRGGKRKKNTILVKIFFKP